MIVRLKSSSPRYPELSAAQPYYVIGIEANDFRILNDNGKPYLYPPDLFEIIDAQHPSDWVTEFGTDGEQYSYPASLNAAGFFEDFFDHKPAQTSTFWHVLNLRLSRAA